MEDAHEYPRTGGMHVLMNSSVCGGIHVLMNSPDLGASGPAKRAGAGGILLRPDALRSGELFLCVFSFVLIPPCGGYSQYPRVGGYCALTVRAEVGGILLRPTDCSHRGRGNLALNEREYPPHGGIHLCRLGNRAFFCSSSCGAPSF